MLCLNFALSLFCSAFASACVSAGFMPVQFLRSFPCWQATLLVFAVYFCLLVPLAGDLDLVRDHLPSESDSEYLVVLTALALAA